MFVDLAPESVRITGNLDHVQRSLDKAAVEFALLGEVDIARKLMEALSLAAPLTNAASNSRSLYFAWKETDHWPENLTNESFIQSGLDGARESYAEHWGSVSAEEQTYDEKGLAACLAMPESTKEDSASSPAALNKSQRLVKALDISLRLAGPIPQRQDSSEATHSHKKAKLSDETVATKSDDLSERLKVSDLDPKSAEIVNKIVARWSAYQQASCLAEAELLWPYYVRGVMMDALGMKRHDLQAKGRELLEVFTKRLGSGYTPSRVEGKSIHELLEMGDQLTVGDDNPEAINFWEECGLEERPETLWREAATDTEIEELEDRIGICLPDDFKEFLRLSNGFGGGDGDGIFNGIILEPALYSTSEIEWTTCSDTLSDLPVKLLDLPREIRELVLQPEEDSGEDGVVLQEIDGQDHVLEIGNEDRDHIWLLQPSRVERYRTLYIQMYEKADDLQKKIIVRAMESFAGSSEAFEAMEWCCLTWSAGGSAMMNAYPSFRRYLESVISDSLERKQAAIRASSLG